MSFKKPVSVLVVIHTGDNDILLLERAAHAGYWQSVTGSQEGDESLADTAAREVREETGIDVAARGLTLRDWRQTNTYEIFPEWRHRYAPGVTENTEHVFSLAVPRDIAIRTAADEHSAHRWLPLAEAAEAVFSWSNRDAILQLSGPARHAPSPATRSTGIPAEEPGHHRRPPMPHPNAELVARLYAALGKKDGEAIAACYRDDARFSDPVFRDLDAREVCGMWKMLCARATDLTVVADDIVADDTHGSARWTATYTFGKTGRKVRNEIDARYEFRNGKISRHTDRFNLWRWSGMALGAKGWLLGWTPLVQNAIRREARRGLQAWLARPPA